MWNIHSSGREVRRMGSEVDESEHCVVYLFFPVTEHNHLLRICQVWLRVYCGDACVNGSSGFGRKND